MSEDNAKAIAEFQIDRLKELRGFLENWIAELQREREGAANDIERAFLRGEIEGYQEQLDKTVEALKEWGHE